MRGDTPSRWLTELAVPFSILIMSTERVEVAKRLTRDEAGDVLNKSLRTIDRYIAQGKLTPVKFHNGHVELNRSEVEALLEPVAS